MRRAVLTVSFFVFAFALAPSGGTLTANAQPSEPTAPELAEKGKRARELGRLEEAIDAYARAYQMSGETGLLFKLAEVHRDAGHLEDALRIFQTYVRRDPDGANRAVADQQVQDLERRIEKSKQTRALGAPAIAAPAPGAPAIAAPAPKTAPVAASPPPATPVAPARVVPPAPTQPPSMVVPPVAQTTAAPAGADLVAPPPPPASESAALPLPRWVPWALTAATVGLGVGAIVSGLSASNRYDQLHDSCGGTAGGCAAADIDDVRSRARRANILWLLTSAAAVGAGVTVYVNVNAAGAAGLWSF